MRTTLEPHLTKQYPSISTEVGHNLAKPQYVELCNRSLPVLALNKPKDAKARVLRLNNNVNRM